MNYAILNAIEKEYRSFNFKSFNKKEHLYYKTMLFRKYMDHKEELVKFFRSIGICYLTDIDCPCPGPTVDCAECAATHTYNYFLNQINKYPYTEEEEIERSI